MTEAAAEIDRRAARVLLLDPSGRVLLLRGCDPARPEHQYWFTVGGGLEPGETLADAAVREVYEETGLRIAPGDLAGPVRTDRVEFPFDGRWYSQEQSFFVVRAEAFTVDLSRLVDYEADSVDEARWWSVGDLDATGERFYPADLATLLREVG
ncbi:NUDIX hydrolase [Dactylosporangium salmoneum]|uniref:Nudix hydrolase domain-containing protein n=1 Tax=Dactylosporangium salmoneum TaxID=53361 RepID=A0ABN3HHT0_9ACTN